MPRLDRFSALSQGLQIPLLGVEIDRLGLIKYAGASDDYVRQHWDHPFMIAQGYPDVIGHGWLTAAHMLRAVTDWAPPAIIKISGYAVRYHKPFHPGLLECGGTVESVVNNSAKLSLWARNKSGAAVATGSATLTPAGHQ
jgi:acyl dehydratase